MPRPGWLSGEGYAQPRPKHRERGRRKKAKEGRGGGSRSSCRLEAVRGGGVSGVAVATGGTARKAAGRAYCRGVVVGIGAAGRGGPESGPGGAGRADEERADRL